jgi:hypothetical protein
MRTLLIVAVVYVAVSGRIGAWPFLFGFTTSFTDDNGRTLLACPPAGRQIVLGDNAFVANENLSASSSASSPYITPDPTIQAAIARCTTMGSRRERVGIVLLVSSVLVTLLVGLLRIKSRWTYRHS